MTRQISVALLNTKTNNPNFYIVNAIHQALRRNPEVGRVDLLRYDDAVAQAQRCRYDLLLAVDGESLNRPIMNRLRALVGTSVLWAWEDPYELPVNLANAALFDLVFTNDPTSVGSYGGAAAFLPLAASTKLPIRASDAEYDYDLFFAGSAWPNRVVFLRKLLRTFTDLRTRVVLQYNPGLPQCVLDLPRSDYAGSISHPDFLALANRSRVTLTLHRDFSGDGEGRSATSPGPRLFETALAGGYQLVDGTGMHIHDLFASGREIDVFTDFAQMATLLRDALAHPEQRIAKARAAQARAEAEHSYDARIAAILKAVTPKSTSAGSIATGRPASRKRILFCTHNTVAYGNFGGVEVYQDTLAKQFKGQYEVLYFRPAHPPLTWGQREYIVVDDNHRILASYLVPDFNMWETLSHPPLEDAFARVLDSFAIDFVHFHHVINHCASLPLISSMLGIPSVFTFQDFWSVCTHFNLIDHRNLYCHVAERPRAICDVCLLKSHKIQPGAQSSRREFFSHVLSSFDRIIANTSSSMDICLSVYPQMTEDQFVVLGLPNPQPSTRLRQSSQANRATDGGDGTLKVVFLGNFTRHKGADTFLEVASVMRDEDIAFTVCGRVDDNYSQQLDEADLPNVSVEGGFEPGQLDLTRFDVALHLSIWPETYCITLSEAWQAGLVPIVSACGALSDRVTHDVDGFQVPIDGSGELVTVLRRLLDRREIARIKGAIGPHLWLTPAQHATSLMDLYENLMALKPQHRRMPLADVETGAPTTLGITRLASGPTRWTVPTAGPLIALLDEDAPGASGIWRQQRAVRAALAEGRVDPASSLDWWVDEFGGDEIALASWSSQPPELVNGRAPTIALRGWFSHAEGAVRDLYLAARSLNGELVLQALTYHPRPDLPKLSPPVFNAIGFQSAAIIPAMLDWGIYGLELMRLRSDGVLEVGAVAASIVRRGGTTLLLSQERHNPVQVLVPGRAWRSGTPATGQPFSYFLDRLDVANVAPSHTRPAWVLELSGWLVQRGLVGRAPALQLRGPADCFLALKSVPRPDVRAALGPEVGSDTGVAGAVWLEDLTPGDYTVGIVYQHRSEPIVYDLLRLHVGVDGAKPLIEETNLGSRFN